MVTAKFIDADRGLEVKLARMTEHDLLEVVEIEEASGLSPWGWDAYHKELQSPQDVLMLVARLFDSSATFAGFIVARLVDRQLHIYNVAVRQEVRQKGVAGRLLRAAMDWGAERGAQLAFLEVRAGNTAAQGLYSHCGFTVTGRRKGYYSFPKEDALLMSVSLESKP